MMLRSDYYIRNKISAALSRLHYRAIPNTEAANLIENMQRFVLSAKNKDTHSTVDEPPLSAEASKLAYILGEYAEMESIPVAISAIAPYFLLNRSSYPEYFIKEIIAFLNRCILDQSSESVDKMKEASEIISNMLRL